MTERSALWLDGNLILRAGAGTGKTHALTTLGLSLCAGFRREGPLPADRLWMLTFTEKAAGELRARLLQRAEALAQDDSGEPELHEAAEAAGVAFPSTRRWAELRAELVGCRATTLHGACGALLRELPTSDLASFETWDELRSAEPLRQAAREAVLAGDTAAGLLEELALDGMGERAEGLVGLLSAVHRKLAEDGLSAEGLRPPREGAVDVIAAARDWRASFERLAWVKPKFHAALQPALGAWPDVATPAELADRLWEIWDLLTFARGPVTRRGPEGMAAIEAHEHLYDALCAPRLQAHWEAFRSLLVETGHRYERMKRRAYALDFTDLCNRARDLLRDDLAARRIAKARVGALLLDESQDTNRVQMELCLLLAERRGEELAFEVGAPIEERIALEPGIFCAVGDRKQSIYGFRGADVSVVEKLRSAVLRNGGAERSLNVCRRSRPELLDFFHALFPRVLTSDGADYEVAFDREVDGLMAWREPLGQPAVELLKLPPPADEEEGRAEARRVEEAEALAERTAELLRHPPVELAPGGELRPGHIAVLFRTATNLGLFRAAFEARGIPCAVVGGDGFYTCLEIQDAVSLLVAMVNSGDGLAALSVLRSPLCGVSDETVARLSFARRRGGLSLHDLDVLPEGIDAADRIRLEEFRERFTALKAAVVSLGPGRLLSEAELLFDQKARYGDAQAFANLDKLASFGRDWEARGMSTAEFIFRLQRACVDEPREELAPAVDELDLSAVRMMTVHQAKGLEFPVVMVPECGSSGREYYGVARYVRGRGLALKARGPDGRWHSSKSYKDVAEEARRRDAADQSRLLYVASTRASELLIFSGEKVRGARSPVWRELLDQVADRMSLVTTGPPPEAAPMAAVPTGSIQAGLRATRPLGPIALAQLPLPVTAAANLALCPRRYQLGQLWHLAEGGEAAPWPEDLPDEDDPRKLGSVAHGLLERVDLAWAAKDPEAALRAALKMSPQQVGRSVLAEVRAVLASRLGREIAMLPAAQVRRETRFVLGIGDRPRLLLRGSIDLLCLLPERALVLDYKRGPPADPQERSVYRAQVEIYALAAHDLTGGHLPIWGGLWFLGEASRGPRTWRILPERLAELREELHDAAAAVAGRPSLEGYWEGREIGYCRATQCPYLARCHGAAS
jgi:ATP-dependent helicase/nuclease subunit A